MLHTGARLEVMGALSSSARTLLQERWDDRQAAIDTLLRDTIRNVCEDECIVAAAQRRLGEARIAGAFGVAVYCRAYRPWETDEQHEFGLKFTPSAIPDAPRYLPYGILNERNNVTTGKRINQLHAGFLAVIALRNIKWAGLRGLFLSHDATELVLPESA